MPVRQLAFPGAGEGPGLSDRMVFNRSYTDGALYDGGGYRYS